MISNDPMQRQERQPDKTIREEHIEIERKKFTVALKENERGRFVRITETAAGRRNMIVVPQGGIYKLTESLKRVGF